MPSIQDFDFALPKELVATLPSDKREFSKLMVLLKTGQAHHQFYELADLIEKHIGNQALLVFNDTKVIPARIYAYRINESLNFLQKNFSQHIPPDQKPIEFLLLSHQKTETHDLAAFCEQWTAIYRNKKPLIKGDLFFVPGTQPLFIQIEPPLPTGEFCISLFGNNTEGLLSTLNEVGQIPLPPYIEKGRGPNPLDRERYQTIYAQNEGAIAAPTAGLHFSHEIMQSLTQRGYEQAFLTLHVGFGTFAPVKKDLAQHKMHYESYEIKEQTVDAIHRAKSAGKKIIAVGTTVVRALESAACNSLDGQLRAVKGQTNLLIHPPYQFKIVDALITNFHLPKSTLLLLVAAFIGKNRCLAAYQKAIEHNYRFYSYGDAMLIPQIMEDV